MPIDLEKASTQFVAFQLFTNENAKSKHQDMNDDWFSEIPNTVKKPKYVHKLSWFGQDISFT